MASAHRTSDLDEIRSRIRSGSLDGHSYSALLGFRSFELRHLLAQVRKGFRYSVFVRFQRNTRLSQRALSDLTQIPLRTLTRRRGTGKLDPVESDRLLRASRIFGRALELFEGDDDAARAWLTSEQPALGGLVPLAVAESEVGANEVERLIGRLEHGLPS